MCGTPGHVGFPFLNVRFSSLRKDVIGWSRNGGSSNIGLFKYGFIRLRIQLLTYQITLSKSLSNDVISNPQWLKHMAQIMQ